MLTFYVSRACKDTQHSDLSQKPRTQTKRKSIKYEFKVFIFGSMGRKSAQEYMSSPSHEWKFPGAETGNWQACFDLVFLGRGVVLAQIWKLNDVLNGSVQPPGFFMFPLYYCAEALTEKINDVPRISEYICVNRECSREKNGGYIVKRRISSQTSD